MCTLLINTFINVWQAFIGQSMFLGLPSVPIFRIKLNQSKIRIKSTEKLQASNLKLTNIALCETKTNPLSLTQNYLYTFF